jgi:hypothetical protein
MSAAEIRTSPCNFLSTVSLAKLIIHLSPVAFLWKAFILFSARNHHSCSAVTIAITFLIFNRCTVSGKVFKKLCFRRKFDNGRIPSARFQFILLKESM